MSGGKKTAGAAVAAAPVVPTQAGSYAETREIMELHGLKKAWVGADGRTHFDADYVATLPADTLTLIEA